MANWLMKNFKAQESSVSLYDNVGERSSVLNMMYDTVVYLGKDIYYCIDTKDSKVVVYNQENNILEGNLSDIQLVGKFVVQADVNKGTQIIHSFTTGKSFICPRFMRGVKQITNDYINYSADYEQVLLNINLEEVYRIQNETNSFLYFKKINGRKMLLSHYVNGKHNQIMIDIITDKVDYYDSIDITDDYKCIAVELKDKYTNGLSINTGVRDFFRYKLVGQNRITLKTYEDITKPQELFHTDNFYSHDIDKKGNSTKGLISKDCVELLPAVYSEIKYINFDNYIVEYKDDTCNYYSLYNSIKGVIYDFGQIKNATIYDYLGIALLTFMDNQMYIVDMIDGSQYSLNDIYKHLICYYCEEEPGIIKVDSRSVSGLSKYINTNLHQINNKAKISKLMTYKWNRIVVQ